MSDRRKDAAQANRSGKATYRPVQQSIARTIVDADNVSLKRLAWAYGCAQKGSSEEKQLEVLLLARVRPEAEAENAELRNRVADLEHRLAELNRAPAEGVGP